MATAATFFDNNLLSTGPAFCPHCGTILDLPETDNIVCDCCAYSCHYRDLNRLEVVTQSQDLPAPAWLDQTAVGSDDIARTTIEEPCPKCNNPKMKFYTMQLRSADEGQTVFYECPKCDHKFSVNT